MKPIVSLIALLTAASLTSCGLLYTDIKVPRGYRTASPSEVKSAPDDPTVTGKACNRSALFLFAWGDGSYAAALKDALGSRDGILYDARADVTVDAYLLGIYAKWCTVLSGRVAKP
ncbi:MAG: TRL domain-containing protein [Elusimicrobiota bacterium]